MPRKVVRRRRKKSYRAPIFFSLTAIVALIGVLAASFCLFIMEDMRVVPAYDIPVGNVVFCGVDFTSVPKVQGIGGSLEGTPVTYKPKAAAPAYESLPTKNVKAVTPVPETAPAPEGYFDDALFIGDSVSEGFKNSGALPAGQIIANKNVGLNAVASGEAVYYTKGTEPKTLWQAIEELNPNPGKLYVLLGVNSIGFDNDYHITFYYQLVEQLKEKYPKAIIYVESVTPKAKVNDYPNFTQEKLNEFNDLIRQMAAEEQVYYLDVQTALKDEEGYMVAEYAPTDGLHMVRKGHDVMVEYYKHHVVLEDGTMDEIISTPSQSSLPEGSGTASS